MIGRANLAADPGLATLPGQLERRQELDGILAAWSGSRPGLEAEAAFQGAGVAAYRVVSGKECLADPRLVARGHFVPIDHLHGPRLVENARVVFARTPARIERPADLAAAEALE